MASHVDSLGDMEFRLAALTSDGSPGAAAVEKLQAIIGEKEDLVYAMIDPTLRDIRVDPLFSVLANRAEISEPRKLPIRHRNIDDRFIPVLLRIDLSRATHSLLLRYLFGTGVEDWSADSLNEGLGHRFCGAFVSKASIESVARHFADMSIRQHPRGGTAWMRWFDPAVIDRLWYRLDSSQQSNMLHPCAHWVGFDRTAAVDCRINPKNFTDDLALTKAQWALLDNLSIINTEIVEHEAQTDEKVGDEQRRSYEDMVMRISKMKISEARDIRTLLRFALRNHPAIDTHPRVARQLSMRSSSQTVSHCLAAFSDADWKEICGELSA